MSELSCSFTLGKLSAGNANVEHNNREFISSNVDVARTVDNIVYVRRNVRDVYDELFGEALEQYNEKQKRRDRKIYDYYEHICNGNREESYYEIVVQFGDMDSASVGSKTGELAKKMLDEYMRNFQQRNKNLCVFNSVLHLDENSPHLHINFIPFYTPNLKHRQKGLSKGVSMRAALEEQGFSNKNKSQNSLVAWENSEMNVMENILNNNGLWREVIGATHSHKSVPDYKESQDWKKLPKRRKNLSTLEVYENDLRRTREENSLLKIEKEKLTAEKFSPWKSFYYSSQEKQDFVMNRLTSLTIPFRETENGFEAQQCFVEEIRKIEKQYNPAPTSHREVLRNYLDKITMQSKDFEDVLRLLSKSGYTVKRGKYISVLPKDGSQYIRLKSLGEEYSEQAIKDRIVYKQRFENEVNNKIKSAENQDTLEVLTLKNIRHYTVIFARNILPVRKLNKNKPFTWENCEELNRLAELNKKINAGLTLGKLRNEFVISENSVAQYEKRLDELTSELEFNKHLYGVAVKWYGGDKSNRADLELLEKHKLTMDEYGRLKNVIAVRESEITNIEELLSVERTKLKSVSDTLILLEKVVNGTHIKSLVDEEKHRRQANFIGNGVKSADGSDSERIETVAERIMDLNIPKPAEQIVQNQHRRLRK